MKLNRRDFIKANAVAAAISAAGLPGASAVAAAQKDEIRWDKAPCRFCGTGCGVLVGLIDLTPLGRMAAWGASVGVVQVRMLLDVIGPVLPGDSGKPPRA